MNEEPRSPESTTASGPMLGRATAPFVIGFMLAAPGTSAGAPLPPKPPVVRHTDSGEHRPESAGIRAHQSPEASPIAAISEVRRLSGLTWEQLAQLVGVSRRALHFWASGKPMSAQNAEHLQRLLAVLQRVDRGSASANRAALFAPIQGVHPFDLLVRHDYERAVRLLGANPTPARPPRSRPSAQALDARAPRPPAELVDALEDTVHQESGRVRKAKSVKVRGGD